MATVGFFERRVFDWGAFETCPDRCKCSDHMPKGRKVWIYFRSAKDPSGGKREPCSISQYGRDLRTDVGFAHL